MKKFIKNFSLILISLIISIYVVEGILLLITPDEEKNLINLNEIRVENAKKLNLKYDLRSPGEAFKDMRKKIDNLSINYRFIKFNSDTQNITSKYLGFEFCCEVRSSGPSHLSPLVKLI